jgi:endoribonuclease Dicer
VHKVILASAEDVSATSAGRMASLLALDALEGDADFMTRTCDCRTHLTHKKLRNKSDFERALEEAFAGGLAEDDSDGEDKKRVRERLDFERELGIGLGLTKDQEDEADERVADSDGGDYDMDEQGFEGLI